MSQTPLSYTPLHYRPWKGHPEGIQTISFLQSLSRSFPSRLFPRGHFLLGCHRSSNTKSCQLSVLSFQDVFCLDALADVCDSNLILPWPNGMGVHPPRTKRFSSVYHHRHLLNHERHRLIESFRLPVESQDHNYYPLAGNQPAKLLLCWEERDLVQWFHCKQKDSNSDQKTPPDFAPLLFQGGCPKGGGIGPPLLRGEGWGEVFLSSLQ